MDKRHRALGYFDPEIWQHQLEPSPREMAQAMIYLREFIKTDDLPRFAESIGDCLIEPPGLLQCARDSCAKDMTGQFSRIGRNDWIVENDNLFWSYVEESFTGWDTSTWENAVSAVRAALLWRRRHGEELMPESVASQILDKAEQVLTEVEQTQADINRAVHVGREQRKRAIAAGKSRQPLTKKQQIDAAKEIGRLIERGTPEQTACKQLSRKYGVHFRTLKRYFRGAADQSSQIN